MNPSNLSPEIMAEINAAEERAGLKAGLEAKRKRRKWILIGAFIGAVILAGVVVVLIWLAQGQAQIKAQGHTLVRQNKTIVDQGVTITAQTEAIRVLQQNQADNSANGRATLKQIKDLTSLIASFTDPNSAGARERAATTASAIRQLLVAQQIQSQDQLRKLGEIAVALAPPDQTARIAAAVAMILAEAPPPITIPTAPTAPAPTPKTVPTPAPSRSPAVNLQVQCPVVCPTTP